MQRFRGGLVFKAHRLLYHSTLGLRVIKKGEGQYHIGIGDVMVLVHQRLLHVNVQRRENLIKIGKLKRIKIGKLARNKIGMLERVSFTDSPPLPVWLRHDHACLSLSVYLVSPIDEV